MCVSVYVCAERRQNVSKRETTIPHFAYKNAASYSFCSFKSVRNRRLNAAQQLTACMAALNSLKHIKCEEICFFSGIFPSLVSSLWNIEYDAERQQNQQQNDVQKTEAPCKWFVSHIIISLNKNKNKRKTTRKNSPDKSKWSLQFHSIASSIFD